jgi:ribosome-binding protein aMBF1 (putative translation factor)
MTPPVCNSCTKEQRGIVHFHWSEGAVVYECRDCGAFNEVGELSARRWRPASRDNTLRPRAARAPDQNR